VVDLTWFQKRFSIQLEVNRERQHLAPSCCRRPCCLSDCPNQRPEADFNASATSRRQWTPAGHTCSRFTSSIPVVGCSLAPIRAPSSCDSGGDAQMDDGAQIEPDWDTDWDGAAKPAQDFEVDQRVNW
jgi:hypothetical protein